MARQNTISKSGGNRRISTKSLKKATSRPAKSRPTKRGGETPRAVAGDEVSIDRRRSPERRGDAHGEADALSEARPQLERRKKVNRRRQIDPTTCERDYTDQEVEFMNALDEYKRKSGRMFPTCSEVLEVVRGLGYIKLSQAEMEALPGSSAPAASAKPMPSDWSTSTTQEYVDQGGSISSLSRTNRTEPSQ